MTIIQKHLLFIPICLVAFAAVFGMLVMILWNRLMPSIFGLPELSFWQAVGLLLLCKLLFGGITNGHHHHGCHADKNRLRERWENMTPEERQRIIDEKKEK